MKAACAVYNCFFVLLVGFAQNNTSGFFFISRDAFAVDLTYLLGVGVG